jgi:tetratricopeptide (TPR) repeat protein
MPTYAITPGDALTSALVGQQDNRKSLSTQALSSGLQYFQDGKYEKAVSEFKRAVALNPESADAYTYLGNSYIKLKKYDEAIAAYKKPVILDQSSTDAKKNLANAYMEAEQYDNAEETFLKMAKQDPRSPYAHNSLGYLYMKTGREDEAVYEFQKVISLSPYDGNGYYGLGLAYNKQEKYADAVKQFQEAIRLKKDFAFAEADLGYSYIGLGEKEKAQKQVDILYDMNTDQSNALATELELSLQTPQIVDADVSESTFLSPLGPGTSVSILDSSLRTAGASKNFSMVFQFNQQMDIASVQNTFNWSISKAKGGTGGWYNNGVTINQDREIVIPPFATSVSYDPTTYQATVYFSVTQNANANAITDPSHWVFKFAGTDVSGNAMDSSADEYDGWASKPF